jgi:hypothetical protein
VDEVGKQRSAIRGLATVALLKMNFDAGQDHISMFEPFVLDALAQLDADGVSADDVRSAVEERNQLALPVNTVRTVLGRAVKRGFQRREGGRYFRTDKRPSLPDLRLERRRVEERQRRLADVLREASAERGLHVAGTEEALDMILDFLDQHHVSLALHEIPDNGLNAASEPLDDPVVDLKTTITAAFLREIVLAEGELAVVVQEMLEGFILQNTLLLRDVSLAPRQFKNLRAFFDSGLLFGALGYRGEATETAVRELLALLRDTGASVEVFEPTIREMRRILSVYENLIGTHEGRLSLFPTDVTRYFLTHHYNPSDIRSISATLERDLRALAFSIRDLPPHEPELTLGEDELGRLLATRPGGENEPRVVHDIDCVAGVLNLRHGKASDSLDEVGAIFATLSSLTTRTICDWYQSEGGVGFPPIIHYLLLSNLAWLKRPASASRLKLHELVALCTAALRPTRPAWDRFLRYLRTVEKSGELSSDEVTTIIASSLTDRVLVEEEVDEESDAATLSEVVDRVKAAYKAELDAELRRVKDDSDQELRKAKDAADAQLQQTRVEADRSEAEVARFRMHIEGRARSLAKNISWILAGLLGASLLVGTAFVLIDAFIGTEQLPAALALMLVPLAVVGLLGMLWGFHVKAWRRKLEDRLTGWVRSWMSGSS